jgi:hypothetical protein
LGYNTSISKQSFIFISLVLITSITSVPAIQSQSPIQTQTQPSTTDNSQIVKEIAEKVATANPGTNATFVEQILTELTRQSAQVSNQGNVLEEIYSQVSSYPYGIVSQSLARFAHALSTNNSVLLLTVQKIIQELTTGKSIPQSIVNIAVQDASGGGKNVNDEISLAAQIIAKQSPGLPLRNIESIIIQMTLEISKAQGKAITGQTIFEIASQIKQNPNGVLTRAIIQLAKQDTQDNGKTGQTVKTVKTIVTDTKKSDSPEKTDEKITSNKKTPSINSPIPIQPGPVSPPKPIPRSEQSIVDEIVGGTLREGLRFVFGNEMEKLQAVFDWTEKTLPLISQSAKLKAIAGILLPTTNAAGAAQASGTLNSVQSSISINPDVVNSIGRLAALYESGNDATATEISNLIANRVAQGTEPSMAIIETPIPEHEIRFTMDQMSVETEPLATYEVEVKSLPPSSGDIIFPVVDGQYDLPVEPLVIPEPTLPARPPVLPQFPPDTTTVDDQPEAITTPEVESMIPSDIGDTSTSTEVVEPEPSVDPSFVPEPSEPGLGPLTQSPLTEKISSLPPLDTSRVEDQPEPFTTPPQTELTLNECLINPGQCQEEQEPSSQPPAVDICQEQWYLPECTQNGNDNVGDDGVENSDYVENIESGESPDVGSYQEEEDSGDEEDDYEEVGAYQAAEEDYSEEEDSGDEEDDYEEVGGYQEEEEQYSEEDSEEEEDFSEEGDESGEYYEE